MTDETPSQAVDFSSLVDISLLGRFKTKTDAKYATQTALTTLGGRVTSLENVGSQANVIESVKVNGTAQTITNKAVDISVPVNVSDVVNDAGYQTAAQVQSAISTALASAVVYKGSVATYDQLPTGATVKNGDMWNVTADDSNYCWNGNSWDKLATTYDLSDVVRASDITLGTTAQIDAMFE